LGNEPIGAKVLTSYSAKNAQDDEFTPWCCTAGVMNPDKLVDNEWAMLWAGILRVPQGRRRNLPGARTLIDDGGSKAAS